ncbi:MAG: glycosyltransferase family 2 protein [Bacteroidetes bacterium]|nr:glycosyltransferase family 2 protein [Bacteroidota bacterium]
MNKLLSDYISVIITTKNEEDHIFKCIKSIVSQNLIENLSIEILIIDGMSTDQTREIVKSFIRNDKRIRLLDNVKIHQSAGFNIGVRNARGSRIAWFGAHSEYPPNYLSSLYVSAVRSNSDYTGGVIETIPYDSSYSAAIVQALTTHRFGVGNSGFRTSAKEGSSDTASYGLFNKRIFTKIGYFDERLLRAQDFEFNARIRKCGGKVWLNPNLIVKYKNQPNLYKFLKKQIISEAPYNAYMWYLSPYAFTYRHAITGVFTFGVLNGIILSPLFSFIKLMFLSVMAVYTVISLISSFQQAIRYKQLKHILFLPFSFFLYHFLHGFGLLKGIVLLIIKKAPVQKIKEPWKDYGCYRVIVKKILDKKV